MAEQKNKTDKVEFIAGINETLANAIRRSVNEIPILAIDEVEIHKNDSALYDEMIAHRIGLLPLETEKNFIEIRECSCGGKGCMKCTAELKINAKGPCTVYANNLKGKATVIYEKIPIVILDKNQELILIAKARLGKGIEHTKFSPGLVYYKNFPEIKINRECDYCGECIEICPRKILRLENKKISVTDIKKCDFCLACVEKCKEHGKDAIKINKTDKIVFHVESFGQISAKDIVVGAVKALKSNLKELRKIK